MREKHPLQQLHLKRGGGLIFEGGAYFREVTVHLLAELLYSPLTTGQNWKRRGSIIFILVLVLLGIMSGAWWLLVSEGKLQVICEQWVLISICNIISVMHSESILMYRSYNDLV